jgi:hypothetical protein
MAKPNPQTKGASRLEMEMERVAREELDKILAKSIEKKWEYGAVICAKPDGTCMSMPARTDQLPNTVNVGNREENGSCPAGWKPVAYWHTHPTYSVGGFLGKYNEISPEDKEIAVLERNDANGLMEDRVLDAFVGTLDGSFLKWTAKTGETKKLNGQLKNTAEVPPRKPGMIKVAPPR